MVVVMGPRLPWPFRIRRSVIIEYFFYMIRSINNQTPLNFIYKRLVQVVNNHIEDASINHKETTVLKKLCNSHDLVIKQKIVL